MGQVFWTYLQDESVSVILKTVKHCFKDVGPCEYPKFSFSLCCCVVLTKLKQYASFINIVSSKRSIKQCFTFLTPGS